jgi:catechol 2,3-dioxygenase-like lactoylglutathione lyase family enzyme
MKLLRAATLTVADPEASAARYVEWLDYSVIERGTLSPALAAAWGAPESAGRAYAVLQPSSGADIFLRFVAGDPVPDYRPLRTYGWAAIEICVQDVLKVNERMLNSPFEIIGPPREIDGLPAIYPMQVKGPDGEIVYLTQIRSDLPAFDLPRAASLIDKLFILVLACSDMEASIDWFEKTVGLSLGRKMDIVYTMLGNAFNLPMEQLHTISTVVHERDVFLELDQYPDAATPRPAHAGQLPPGIAICTLSHPDLSTVKGDWITPPTRRDGAVYGGQLTGTLRAPDGTLVELVQLG